MSSMAELLNHFQLATGPQLICTAMLTNANKPRMWTALFTQMRCVFFLLWTSFHNEIVERKYFIEDQGSEILLVVTKFIVIEHKSDENQPQLLHSQREVFPFPVFIMCNKNDSVTRQRSLWDYWFTPINNQPQNWPS